MTENQVKLINNEIRVCKACDRSLKGALKLTKTGKIPTTPPICEACRKFYCRYLKTSESWLCTCGGVRSSNNDDDDKADCRLCRFQRCQIALKQSAEERRSALAGHHNNFRTATTPSAPVTVKQQTTSQNHHSAVKRATSAGNSNRLKNHQSNDSGSSSANQQKSRLDFSKIPCKICGCSSSGIHFGVVSCEGCKGFFRRSTRGNFRLQYRCKRTEKSATLDEEPVELCSPSSNCRKCRLRRCIAAGMSQSESAIGRLNRQARKELDETIERLAKQQSALNEPILRRHHKKRISSSSSKDNKANNSQEKSNSSSQSEADSNSQMVENYNRTLSSSTSSGNSSSSEDEDEDLRNDTCSGSGAKSVSMSFDESGANNCLLSLQPSQSISVSSSGNSSEDSPAKHYHDAEMMEVCYMPNCPFFGPQLARYEEGVDPLSDVVDMSTVAGEDLWSLSGYHDLPRDVPAPNEFNSVELSLVPAPNLHSVISNSGIEASRWLVDRSVDAAVRLAPISSIRIIVDPKTTTKHQMLVERSRAFDIYINSISDFIVNLPGMSSVSIQDRISLFANSFFPLLIAQLSLQFDVVRQMPNHLSLDRDSGTWEMVGHCNSWQHLIERYLCDAGNVLQNTVFNLQEYALLCALLCFNADVPFVGDRDKLNAIQGRYHMAYMHYLQETGGVSQERIDRFHQLLQFFRRSTSVFQCEIRGLPIHCEYFLELSSPLFKDFRLQFMTLTQPPLGPCAGYLTDH